MTNSPYRSFLLQINLGGVILQPASRLRWVECAMAYLDKSIAAEFDVKYPILMDSSGMPSGAAEATDMLDPTMLLFQGIMEKETTSKSERAAHRDAATISEVLLLISLAVLSYSGYYYYFFDSVVVFILFAFYVT